MRLSKLSSLLLTAIFVAGCGVNFQISNINSDLNNADNQTQIKKSFKPVFLSKEDISKLDKEYMTFSTKALTVSYIQKKLLSLIGNDNGVSKGSTIVKELKYYKEKTETGVPFQAMVNSNPTLYSALINVSAVITQRNIDIPFNIFMGGVNPLSAPVANAASAITSTGFTANWNTVANANSGYILTIKQGSTTVSTINLSGQATSSCTVTGLNSSTSYTYSVQAKNGSLLSNISNSISVSTTSGVITYTTVSTIAGSGTLSGYYDANGSSAQFYSPYGITIDSSGNLYVIDVNNQRIRKIANDANYTVSTIAGNGIYGYQDGNGSSAKFYSPYGITVDSTGTLYVADTSNNKIRKIATDSNRTVSTYAGSGVLAGGNGYQDGNATSSKFSYPFGIVADSNGNLFVADTFNNKIRKIANDLEYTVSTIAGSTQGDLDGSGTSAQFYYPKALTIDSSGNLYVADTRNNKIKKIANDVNHTVTTIAGSSQGYLDGSGISAQFYAPSGVTIDSAGNLYVSDTSNNRIRKIANDAIHTVTTVAGSGAGYIDGNGASAKFSAPYGITIDSSGSLYVADTNNNRIRKIQ